MQLFFLVDGGNFGAISGDLEQAFARVATQISGARVVNQRDTQAPDGELPQWDLGVSFPLPQRLTPATLLQVAVWMRDICRRYAVELAVGLITEDGTAEDVDYLDADTDPRVFAADFARVVEG